MRCPECESYVVIEDWQDDSIFECESCQAPLRLITDESTYYGAKDTYLEVADDIDD